MHKNEIEILLCEYQKAQDSAEHHDKLVWTVSSIIIAGMLVLMGLSVDNVADKSLKCLIPLIAVFGILLSVFLWEFQSKFRSIKTQKYDRCKVIEKILRMKQHTELRYQEGAQTMFYRFILIMFVLIWIYILLVTLRYLL